MIDSLRARIGDAVAVLSDLASLAEHHGDRLPPILLARALVQIDCLAARLARLRQALADAAAGPTAGRAGPNVDNARGG
jgi:hypothetical protein